MGKAVDRLIVAKRVRERVEEAYKAAESAAADELATLKAETGAKEIGSMFLEGAGTYKYSTVRAKKVERYAISDNDELAEWIAENAPAVAAWLASKAGRDSVYAEQFGAWWFPLTGEVPDGMTRIEYEEPEKLGVPKVYKYDANAIDAFFEQHGGWLEGGMLLLGDGSE